MPYQQPGHTFHCSDSVRINYEISGEGEQILLFLHGFGAALTTWDDIKDLFPAQKYTLYFLDLLGFGLSATPCDNLYRLEDQAEIVACFIERHNLRDVTLVGHSLGGGIALIIAMRAGERPERVSRLVLIDCACYPQRLPRFFRILKLPFLNRLLLSVVPSRIIVRSTLNTVYHDPRTITPERISRYLSCFSRRGLATSFIRTIQALKPESFREVIAGYPSINLPTLIIWGNHDRVIKMGYGKRLASEIPGAQLDAVTPCGHNPHEECPEEVFSFIDRFIDRT